MRWSIPLLSLPINSPPIGSFLIQSSCLAEQVQQSDPWAANRGGWVSKKNYKRKKERGARGIRGPPRGGGGKSKRRLTIPLLSRSSRSGLRSNRPSNLSSSRAFSNSAWAACNAGATVASASKSNEIRKKEVSIQPKKRGKWARSLSLTMIKKRGVYLLLRIFFSWSSFASLLFLSNFSKRFRSLASVGERTGLLSTAALAAAWTSMASIVVLSMEAANRGLKERITINHWNAFATLDNYFPMDISPIGRPCRESSRVESSPYLFVGWKSQKKRGELKEARFCSHGSTARECGY